MRHLLTLVSVVPVGGNYKTMSKRLKVWEINTDHWGTAKQRQGHLKGKTHTWASKTPLNKILIQNYFGGGTTHRLKQRLIKEGIFVHKCYNCNLTEWMTKIIPLELEHINGDKFDNRIENLTLLCPNCHALTPTYRGKNKPTEFVEDTLNPGLKIKIKRISNKKQYHCKDCNVILTGRGVRCVTCYHLMSRKVNRPSKEELMQLINRIPMTTIGKRYGVSDNSIRKWCLDYNIQKNGANGGT